MKRTTFLAVVLGVLALQSPVRAATPTLDFDVSYAVYTNYLASTNLLGTVDQANGIWLGNLRNKGTHRDLIIANKGDDTVSIRLCNDNRTFGAVKTFAVGLAPVAVRSADFTGDRAEDIVAVNSGTNTISLLLNVANGWTFSSAINYVVGSTPNPVPVALTIGDADGDNQLDILVVNSAENTVSVLLNSGGTFVLSTNIPVGANPQSVQLTDLNGDGRKDILVANQTSGTLTILPKQIDGTFGPAQTITLFPGGDPQPVMALAADFNGDAMADIAAANFASNTVCILTNAAGTFTMKTNISVGSGPRSMVFRDLNLDGKTDIAVAHEGGNSIGVLLGLGNGIFDDLTTVAMGGGTSPASIAGSNFDSGGLNDLAVANNGNNTISILIYDLPLAYFDTKTVLEDVSGAIFLHSTVFSGRPTNYTIVSGPSFGILSGTGANRTYLSDTDFNGTDSFTYRINDGIQDSMVATNIITVTPVNDRPSFTLANNAVTVQNYGLMNSFSVVGTSSVGPANEASQILSFVTTTTNANQFGVKPAISPAGTLTFIPSATASGTVILTVNAKDNAGSLNGGTNLSTPLTISVTMPTNPYPAIKGIYRGLFSEGTVSLGSSGHFQMTLGNYGEFSGKIISGASYAFTGRFNVDGVAQVTIVRGLLAPLTANLTIDRTAGGTEKMTGTITDSSWTAAVEADRATFNKISNIPPQAGSYTMICPGGNDPAASPSGESYARVTVETGGYVRVTGVLADGRAFGQSTYLSKNGRFPLYAALYGYQGAVLSWITFADEFDTSFAGSFSWIKTSAAGGTHYPNGFTNDLLASGSTFTNIIGQRMLALTNGLTRLDGGNLLGALVNAITLSTNNNKVTVLSGGATNLAITINGNGLVTGRFKHPVSGLTASLRGIVFQEQNTIGGFFLGSSQSGVFLLEKND